MRYIQSKKKMRTYNQGWKSESVRHSLAARGVKTGHSFDYSLTSKGKIRYSNDAGYVANKGDIVVYISKEQGLDSSSGKYTVCCHKHHTNVGVSSLKRAKASMKYHDFCEECMKK
jgi:hypothetical protein